MPRTMLEFDYEALTANRRVVAFALANQFLAVQRAFADALDLDPTSVAIFLTVSVTNIQRIARDPTTAPGLRHDAPMPEHMMTGISRRRIAESTGLPRETVRRRVGELIARGLLCETAGGVRGASGFLAANSALMGRVLLSLGGVVDTLDAATRLSR